MDNLGLDLLARCPYYINMMNEKCTKRKRRSDRRHIVYQLTNCTTGEIYIGITAGFRLKDLRVRVQKHVRRALTEDKAWNLCRSIRAHGPESFVYQVREIVRGKVEAHRRERELIAALQPTLNSQ